MNIVPLERSVTSGASGKMTRHWPIGRAPSFSSQGQILVRVISMKRANAPF
jgi:hypothetical protein